MRMARYIRMNSNRKDKFLVLAVEVVELVKPQFFNLEDVSNHRNNFGLH